MIFILKDISVPITYFVFIQLGAYESQLNWSNRQPPPAYFRESANISEYFKFLQQKYLFILFDHKRFFQ